MQLSFRRPVHIILRFQGPKINTEEKTLVGLILEYQQGVSMPKTVALEMEKLCHAEDQGKGANHN